MKSSLADKASSPALRQYAAQREELLDAYFTETQLLQVLHSFLTTLATDFRTKRVLPASPYPRLLTVVRQKEIERSLVLSGAFSGANDASTSPELLLHDQQQQQTNHHLRICSTKELLARSLWGFQPVIERIPDVDQLVNRMDAIRVMHPTCFNDAKEDQKDDDQYRVVVFAALVGHGTSFPLAQYPVIEIEQHVVVAGELLEKAMAVFARQLFKFLHELSTNSSTLGCSGICITPCSTEVSSSGGDQSSIDSDLQYQQQLQVWTTESVNSNRNAFIAAMKIAIVGNASFEITSFSSAHGSVSSPPLPACNNSSSGSRFICQTRQRFFLHFVWENASTSAMKPVKAPQQQQNRSFIVGTRVVESGLFLSARGALQIARRVQIDQDTATTAKANANDKGKKASIAQQQQPQTGTNKRSESLYDTSSSFSLCPTGASLLSSVLMRLRRHTSSTKSPQETRKWTKCFTSSFAFALLTLVLRNQVLLDLLETHNDAAACKEALESHFETSSSQLEVLLEQARVGSTSSLLRSVHAYLETLGRDAHHQFLLFVNGSVDNQERGSLTNLIQQLETVNELLLVVTRVAVRDFVDLAWSHTLPSAVEFGSDLTLAQAKEDNPEEEQQIDVLRAIQLAVDECAYPPLVALECVLAQFLVDSCLDVALESAMLNIVAFHLPPNPFVELSHSLRVFALRQHVWARPLRSASDQNESKPHMLVHKDCKLVLLTKLGSHNHALYGHNRPLLEALDPSQVWTAHHWLKENGMLRLSDYPQPLKSSYSIQIFHSLLAYHATAFATSQVPSTVVAMTSPFLQELEVVEHIVVEGREFAQALEFFADAVAHDLQCLAVFNSSKSSNAHEQLLFPVQVEIRGPLDEIVSDVDLHLGDNDNEAALLELVQEATRSMCVLRAQLTLFSGAASGSSSDGDNEDATKLHIVGKSYLFHHKATDSGSQQQTQQCILELLAFRLKRFGIFFAPENAEYVLESLSTSFATEVVVVQPELWTPFARQALEHDDLLLKYELDFGASEASACTTRYHATDDHKRGILLQRLTVHSWIQQLYVIVSPILRFAECAFSSASN